MQGRAGWFLHEEPTKNAGLMPGILFALRRRFYVYPAISAAGRYGCWVVISAKDIRASLRAR
ncbi:hypothetical protein ACNFH8_05980, partial [Pseudomonas sp. NY15436]|uniref:hypothetical protein n=1 Tax=Pseudomonas sp. NY15436 TaxID=3400359 RepID=UPI003A840BBD